MSYYELRNKLIALSKMLTRARMEKRKQEVIDRIREAIESTKEQLEDCAY